METLLVPGAHLELAPVFLAAAVVLADPAAPGPPGAVVHGDTAARRPSRPRPFLRSGHVAAATDRSPGPPG